MTGFQREVGSTDIVFDSVATPTDDELQHVISIAQALGLKVMLKPHVDIIKDEIWRGNIGKEFGTEQQWADWFASYRAFIEHYADLAKDKNVEQFCIGTEFVGTTHREVQWRDIGTAVKARYDGPITYASNWGGEEVSIQWWDIVDLIGVDAYYPLTTKNNPSLTELKAGWQPHIATLQSLHEKFGRRVLLTELGFRSVDGANTEPWNWGTLDGPVDLQEQVDAYQATFASLYSRPWLAGMFWWMWGTDPLHGGPCNKDYSPHDKPAEDVLRAWYGGSSRDGVIAKPNPDTDQSVIIYADQLADGWESWSWKGVWDFEAKDQVHDGKQAISVVLEPSGGLSLHVSPLVDTSGYHWIEFFLRFSQDEQLSIVFHDVADKMIEHRPLCDCRYTSSKPIAPNAWTRVRVPLAHLKANNAQVTRFSIVNDRSTHSTGTFWLDDIRLLAVKWKIEEAS